MPCVSLLKVLYDPQRMKIVIEALSVALQAPIQSTLPGVTKWRMSDVVRQRKCLCEVCVEVQRRGHLPSHLCHLNRVR